MVYLVVHLFEERVGVLALDQRLVFIRHLVEDDSLTESSVLHLLFGKLSVRAVNDSVLVQETEIVFPVPGFLVQSLGDFCPQRGETFLDLSVLYGFIR